MLMINWKEAYLEIAYSSQGPAEYKQDNYSKLTSRKGGW